MRNKLLSTAAAVGGLLFLAGSANALQVSIQLQQIGGDTPTGQTVVASSAVGTGATGFLGMFGDFANNITGTGTGTLGLLPEPQLIGTTENASTSCTGGCELIVQVTETGLTFPTPAASYTINYDWLAATGNVEKSVFSSYISNTDTPFGDSETIGTPFTAVAKTASLTFGNLVTGISPTFSETEEFDITFGDCTAGCSIQLSSSLTGSVPEPASLSLLGAALIGFGAWRRRRKAA